jgi:hypothetical protein
MQTFTTILQWSGIAITAYVGLMVLTYGTQMVA